MARIAVTCISIAVLLSTQFACSQLREISSQVFTHPSVADTGNVGLCPGQTKRVYEILPESEKLLSCFCRPCASNITLREAYRNRLIDILTEIMSVCIHVLHKRLKIHTNEIGQAVPGPRVLHGLPGTSSPDKGTVLSQACETGTTRLHQN